MAWWFIIVGLGIFGLLGFYLPKIGAALLILMTLAIPLTFKMTLGFSVIIIGPPLALGLVGYAAGLISRRTKGRIPQ